MRRSIICALTLALLLAACGSTGGRTAVGTARTTTSTGGRIAAPKQTIWYDSVGLDIPASWPVIDGAHFQYDCSSTFGGQSDRAFLGVSYQGAPSCGITIPSYGPPPADGVWMQPGGAEPPQQTPTTLPGGQVVYLSTSPSLVEVWWHNVSIEIGIGPDPGIERAILNSIAYRPGTADSPVLGRCPAPDTAPPAMPAPKRLTASMVLAGGDGQMQPAPPDVEPKVSADSVWANLFHQFGAGGFAGPLEWTLSFGEYESPQATASPPNLGVPTWLIQGVGAKTDLGPCGMTVIAPYDATTGRAMGVLMLG